MKLEAIGQDTLGLDMALVRSTLPLISKVSPIARAVPFATHAITPPAWYTKWWVWVLLGGSVLSTSLLVVLLVRRRKSSGLNGALSESVLDIPAFEPATLVESPERDPIGVTTGDAAKEKRCGCTVKVVAAKGGSKRYAAVCGNMQSYISAEEAKKHKSGTFCTKVQKPFNKLSGRIAADRMWAKKRATQCRSGCVREG